jgi:hypothetical protein
MKFTNKSLIAVIVTNLGVILISINARATGEPYALQQRLAFDGVGNLFAADDNSIFKFTPDGTKSTFAAALGDPRDLAFDSKGNLFVADWVASRSLDSHRTEKRAPLPPD